MSIVHTVARTRMSGCAYVCERTHRRARMCRYAGLFEYEVADELHCSNRNSALGLRATLDVGSAASPRNDCLNSAGQTLTSPRTIVR
eukprot:6198778-Pleurochrysis_carterae.AAC.1